LVVKKDHFKEETKKEKVGTETNILLRKMPINHTVFWKEKKNCS